MRRTGLGIDVGWSDHDALCIGQLDYDDPARRIDIPWWWHHRHLDIFMLADVVRVVKHVFAPGTVVGDDGGGHKKTIKSLEPILGLTIEDKPRDLMLSVDALNDEFRSGRCRLATVDLWTPKLLEAAATIYEAEPVRLAKVIQMLTNEKTPDLPKNAPLDLRTEFGQVFKSIHPVTKKVTIGNRRNGGKHSDGTEACRYCVDGLIRAPARPAKPPVTGLQVRLAAMAKRRGGRGPFAGG